MLDCNLHSNAEMQRHNGINLVTKDVSIYVAPRGATLAFQ